MSQEDGGILALSWKSIKILIPESSRTKWLEVEIPTLLSKFGLSFNGKILPFGSQMIDHCELLTPSVLHAMHLPTLQKPSSFRIAKVPHPMQNTESKTKVIYVKQ